MSQKAIACLFAVAGLSVAGCGKDSPPPPNTQAINAAVPPAVPQKTAEVKPVAPPTAPAAPPKAPDFKLTVAEIQKEFQQNKTAADAKYKGKVIEISGPVRESNPGFESRVGLRDAGHTFGQTVHCFFADTTLAGKFGIGQVIRVVGTYKDTDNLGSAYLRSCELLDPGTDTRIKRDAVQFVAEYLKDRDATWKTVSGKTLQLSGTVESFRPWGAGIAVLLKSSGKPTIVCEFMYSPTLEKDYKPGNTIQFITHEQFKPDDKEFVFKECILAK